MHKKNKKINDQTSVLMTGLHHGNEPMSLSMNVYVICKFLYGAKHKDEDIIDILNNIILWSIPIINVDAYE